MAVAVLILGSFILVFRGFTTPNIGDLLVILGPLFAQLSHMFSKKIISALPDPTIIAATRLFYGGICLTFIGIILNPAGLLAFLKPEIFIAIVLFSIIFRTLNSFFWYKTLEKLPASKAAAFLPIAVLVAFLGTIGILHEIPTLRQYFGVLAIIGGTIWLSLLHLKPVKS